MRDFQRNSKAHIFLSDLDDDVTVIGDDHHHLARVMRLSISDHISAACDGKVREYEIIGISRDDMTARAVGEIEEVDELEIHIVVSLFKLDRLEMGIAKAIESGASSITIGSTERSPLSLDASKKEKFLRRANAIALSAAMQSRRVNIVPITFVDSVIDHVRQCETDVVVCEPGGTSTAPQVPITIVIGPEGGFSESEINELITLGKLWSLSPYILRADTAMALASGLTAAAGSAGSA